MGGKTNEIGVIQQSYTTKQKMALTEYLITKRSLLYIFLTVDISQKTRTNNMSHHMSLAKLSCDKFVQNKLQPTT